MEGREIGKLGTRGLRVERGGEIRKLGNWEMGGRE